MTKKNLQLFKSCRLHVPTTGFEPAHLMAPPPQDGMSTNFTTWAIAGANITIVNNLK